MKRNKLPSSVREALQKKAAPGKILKIESLTKHDQLVAYEAQVTTGGNKSETQVGPDGVGPYPIPNSCLPVSAWTPNGNWLEQHMTRNPHGHS